MELPDPREEALVRTVPTDIVENVAWRRNLLELGKSDIGRGALMAACAHSLSFWCGAFVWTYDPRRNPPAVPFIPYGYQIESFHDITEAIGDHDLGIEKSRDMGASWMILLAFTWSWLFHPLKSYLLVSRKEDLVDGDSDSMFWKIDFTLKYLPSWMLPDYQRNKLHLTNNDNGSRIDGESTTGDVARGGRRTAIGLDEFASVPEGYEVLKSTADVTQCRLFNSTPKGTANAFYDVITSSQTERVRFHWTRHPIKTLGLYSAEDPGKVKIHDTRFTHDPDYPFVCDGKLRSVWYDYECHRRHSPQEIAQELDIDYLGSDYQFFDSDTLDYCERMQTRPPIMIGRIDVDYFTLEPSERAWIDDEAGEWRLWCVFDATGRPSSKYEYAIGVDVSMGTGASNSTITVVNLDTGEKVAAYASTRIKPNDLARLVIGTAKWFGTERVYSDSNTRSPALVIFDAGGPGRAMGDFMTQSGFRRLYYHRRENDPTAKTSAVPGYHMTSENKAALLNEHRRQLAEKVFIQRDKRAVDEARLYIVTQTGAIEHSSSIGSVDPTGAKANHGDRVIADALCSRILRDHRKIVVEEQDDMPLSCYAARRERHLNREREASRDTLDAGWQ